MWNAHGETYAQLLQLHMTFIRRPNSITYEGHVPFYSGRTIIEVTSEEQFDTLSLINEYELPFQALTFRLIVSKTQGST